MKKINYIFVFLLILSFVITAGSENNYSKNYYNNKYLNFGITFPFNPISLGYKHPVCKNIYICGNIEYMTTTKDLDSASDFKK